MSEGQVDLCGKVCPYPVVHIIRAVEALQPRQSFRCIVDDPLAIKAVPEELADFDDIELTISPAAQGWEIRVRRG